MKEKVIETNCPAVLRVGKGDSGKLGATVPELLRPARSAIGCLVNTRPDDPARVGIEKEDIPKPGGRRSDVLPGQTAIDGAKDKSAAHKVIAAYRKGSQGVDRFKTVEGKV